MVDEMIAEIIPYDISKTHTDVKLITQEIKEWQHAMNNQIATLIGDETREMILCLDGVKTVGCMWVNNRESRFGGTLYPYTAW